MELLNQIVKTIGGIITSGGLLFAVFGLIQLGTAMKDHQGPAIGSALWQLAGAAAISAAGVLCLSVTFAA